MQFGREPRPKTPEMITADGERGWVCSKHPEHFRLGGELPASEPIASNDARASRGNNAGTLQRELSGGGRD
jgi:hypothetical protein